MTWATAGFGDAPFAPFREGDRNNANKGFQQTLQLDASSFSRLKITVFWLTRTWAGTASYYFGVFKFWNRFDSLVTKMKTRPEPRRHMFRGPRRLTRAVERNNLEVATGQNSGDQADASFDSSGNNPVDQIIERGLHEIRLIARRMCYGESLPDNAADQPIFTAEERSMIASSLCKKLFQQTKELFQFQALMLEKDLAPNGIIVARNVDPTSPPVKNDDMPLKKHSSNETLPSAGVSSNFKSSESNRVSTLVPYEWQVKLFELLPKIAFKETMTVWGSVYESPSEFYVHIDQTTLTKLSYLMQLECAEIAKDHDLNPNQIMIGSVLAAKYGADDKWYRGTVKSINQSNFTIFYFDYGNHEDVAIERLLPLPRSVQDIPVQAVRCWLYGYFPQAHSSYDASIRAVMDDPKGFYETRKFTFEFFGEKAPAIHPESSGIGFMSMPIYYVDVLIKSRSLYEDFKQALCDVELWGEGRETNPIKNLVE